MPFWTPVNYQPSNWLLVVRVLSPLSLGPGSSVLADQIPLNSLKEPFGHSCALPLKR